MRRAALGVCLAVVVVMTAPAATQASSSLFIYRESDIGGESHLWRTPVDQVVATDQTPPVDIIAFGSDRSNASLRLIAPQGERLRVGAYNHARSVFSSDTQPMLYVSRDGLTDGSLEGSFTIRDIGFGPDGQVTRLWATFDERCTCLWAHTFGEVRLGMPDPALQVLPSRLRWPPAYLGRGGVAVPMTVVVNDGSARRVTGVTLAGPDAGHFQVTRDECTGKTVSGAATCEVWVRFNPSTGGEKLAYLDVRDASGSAQRAPLTGGVVAGRTQLAISGGPGNSIAAGRSFLYTPQNSGMSIDGAEGGLAMRLIADPERGPVWHANFIPPAGGKLVPGRFANAVRGAHNAIPGTPQMDVGGDGRGCNTLQGEFTVEHAAFAPDGKLTEVAVAFTQYCDTDSEPLTGRLEYHVGAGTSVLEPPFPELDGPLLPAPGPRPLGAPRGTRPLACGKRFRAVRALRGSPRRDRLVGSAARDVLIGGRGSDRLLGGGGSDCVSGGAGSDLLRGGPGADVLVGGPGRDRLVCGPGSDLAIASRRDVVRGCERVR